MFSLVKLRLAYLTLLVLVRLEFVGALQNVLMKPGLGYGRVTRSVCWEVFHSFVCSNMPGSDQIQLAK